MTPSHAITRPELSLSFRRRRAGFILIVGGALVVGRFAPAQTPAEANSSKLEEHFSLTLRPQQDYAVSVVEKSIAQHDYILRAKELEAANASVFGQALDLLRYVPIKLSASDTDDFFTPGYLRPGYATIPRETHLFNTH